MHRLHGRVRPYAWGSPSAIPRLLGVLADGTPQAELWLGAHPADPARLGSADGEPLDAAVAARPEHWLGQEVLRRFGDRLPFLLKILAAETPLSLQVHPGPDQAAAGFRAEQAAGIPMDSPTRRYKDPWPKPEMLCALTRFEALSGFRQPRDVLAVVEGLRADGLDDLRDLLRGDDPVAALRASVEWLLTEAPRRLVERVVAACAARATHGGGRAEDALVSRLGRLYPDDPGVLIALLLNHVVLDPGQAVYLGAGNVHAYVRGTGVEIMASSDNVLRGGLTPKHVDVTEFLRVVDFSPVEPPYVAPTVQDGTTVWAPGSEEFRLCEAVVDGRPAPVGSDGPRIVLCLEGQLVAAVEGQQVSLNRGEAMAVPHGDGPLTLCGHGRAFVASVGCGK
jgi:mannose-6-phosphate isomerase